MRISETHKAHISAWNCLISNRIARSSSDTVKTWKMKCRIWKKRREHWVDVLSLLTQGSKGKVGGCSGFSKKIGSTGPAAARPPRVYFFFYVFRLNKDTIWKTVLTIRLRFLLRNSQVGGHLFIFFSNPYDTLVFRVLISSWLVSTKPNGSKGTEYSPLLDQCRIRVGVEDKHLLSHLLGQVTNTVQKVFFLIFSSNRRNDLIPGGAGFWFRQKCSHKHWTKQQPRSLPFFLYLGYFTCLFC